MPVYRSIDFANHTARTGGGNPGLCHKRKSPGVSAHYPSWRSLLRRVFATAAAFQKRMFPPEFRTGENEKTAAGYQKQTGSTWRRSCVREVGPPDSFRANETDINVWRTIGENRRVRFPNSQFVVYTSGANMRPVGQLQVVHESRIRRSKTASFRMTGKWLQVHKKNKLIPRTAGVQVVCRRYTSSRMGQSIRVTLQVEKSSCSIPY